MNPESIRTLYGYTYSVFERVWDCIMQLTDEQFIQDIDYSNGAIRNHVVHLMSATRRWMKRLQETELPPHLSFGDFTTRSATKLKWDAMRAEVLDYVYSLDKEHLDEIIHWELPSRDMKVDSPRWTVLLHVANHATDHRAQILAMLNTHFKVKTVEQDLIFYLTETQSNLGKVLPKE